LKLRVLALGVGLTLVLSGAWGLGLNRQLALGAAVSESYQTNSIDEYLGRDVTVPGSVCTAIKNQIDREVQSTAAPRQLSQALEAFNKTVVNGEITPASYTLFRSSPLLSELEISLASSAANIEAQLAKLLEFDTANIRTEAVEAASSNRLRAEVQNLERQGYSKGVSFNQWQGAFERKVSSTCSAQASAAISGAKKAFDQDKAEYASNIRQVLTKNWQSDKYEKLSPLVAYASRDNADCEPDYYGESCAIFYVQTATPCTVYLTVKFEDASNRSDGYGYKSVIINEAKKPRSVTVSGGSRDSRFYEIEVAVCR
jgi:hypothetical protein